MAKRVNVSAITGAFKGVQRMVKDVRKQQLSRIKNMAKRLEREGYILKGGADYSDLSIAKLKKIKSGADLVRSGYYEFSDEAFEAIRRKQNINKIKASIKRAGGFGKVLNVTGYQHIGDDSFMQILESMTDEDLRQLADERKVRSKVAILSRSGMIEKRSDSRSLVGADIRRGEQQQLEVISMLDRDANRFNNNGHNIRVLNVFGGTEETMYVDKLLAIAEYGENYNGWYGKADSTAVPFINKTGTKLADMITSARMRHTDKEIYDRIEARYPGGLQEFANELERLVLSIYDPIYRGYGSTGGVYNQEMNRIKTILSF